MMIKMYYSEVGLLGILVNFKGRRKFVNYMTSTTIVVAKLTVIFESSIYEKSHLMTSELFYVRSTSKSTGPDDPYPIHECAFPVLTKPIYSLILGPLIYA